MEGSLAQSHEDGADVLEGNSLVLEVSEDGIQNKSIATNPGNPTKEELLENRSRASEGQLQEINGLDDLKCFKRLPRKQAKNIVDTRWVITWKRAENQETIKC